MIRINRTEKRSRTLFTVDGYLSGEYAEVVGTCCDQAMSTGKPVELFLRDVSVIDQAGRALLCRLAAKGVRLLASGIYTSYVVRMLKPASLEPLNPSKVAGGPSSEATGREL